MGITVDDPRAHELASELAALTGESLDEAITKALEERLERQKARQQVERQRRLAAIRDIQERVRAVTGGKLTSDHSDLYDEFGLPKW
jgi:antitoxin VapB